MNAESWFHEKWNAEDCLIGFLDVKFFLNDDWQPEMDMKQEFKMKFLNVIDHIWTAVVHHSGAYEFRPMFEDVYGHILDRTMFKVRPEYMVDHDPRWKNTTTH
jgi:hypothetical protein